MDKIDPIPEDIAVVDDDKKSPQSGVEAAEACDDSASTSAATKVATPRKKRVAAPKKKVVMERVVAPPETLKSHVDIADPLFFAKLNVLHRKTELEAKRTKMSMIPIVLNK